jgi:hypothetical protein
MRKCDKIVFDTIKDKEDKHYIYQVLTKLNQKEKKHDSSNS